MDMLFVRGSAYRKCCKTDCSISLHRPTMWLLLSLRFRMRWQIAWILFRAELCSRNIVQYGRMEGAIDARYISHWCTLRHVAGLKEQHTNMQFL